MPLNPICPNCGHKNALVVPIFDRRRRYDPNADPSNPNTPTLPRTVAGKTYKSSPAVAENEVQLQAGDLIPEERVVKDCGLCRTPLQTTPDAAIEAVNEVKDGADSPDGGPVPDHLESGSDTPGQIRAVAGTAGGPSTPAV